MIYFVFAVLIVLIDRGIKMWIDSALEIGQALEFIPGVLRIVHVENTGAAFSIFKDMRWPLVTVSSIAVIVLIFVILLYRDGELGRLAASFMLGGAAGNLIDRIISGRVIDMFEPEFVNFAIFNVADIFVTVGCLIFIGHLIHLAVEQGRLKKAGARAAAPAKTEKTQQAARGPDNAEPVDEQTFTEHQILMDYFLEQEFDDRDS